VIKKYTLLFFLAFLFSVAANAQGAPACPSVEAGADVSMCSGQCAALNATLVTNNQTTSYSVAAIPYVPYPYNVGTAILVATDDIWSPIENIGFNFCFFGNTYNQFIIGANGHVSFNLGSAGAIDNYPVTTPLPSTVDMPANTINAVFRDIDPALGGNIYYKMYGASPCRAMVVSWFNVPLYDNGFGICNGTPNSTFQLVFYENTNYIDVYVQNSFSCPAWQSGNGIIGIQNAAATTAVCPPGRNCTPFTTTNEAWRFSPTGAPSFALNWYQVGSGTSLGTSTALSVCPTVTTSYAAVMVLTNCDGSTVTEKDTVTVNITNTLSETTSTTDNTCVGSNNGTASVTMSGGALPYTYSWSPSGGTAATASGLAAGVYTITVTDNNGCGLTNTLPINDPPVLTATGVPGSELCAGQSTATASVSPSGGTGAYTFSWAPAGGTNSTTTPLPAGNYTCTITDQNGCNINKVVTISDPPALTATGSGSAELCAGASTATATVNPSGGTGIYTYSWDPAGGTGQTTTGLPAGTYTCTITDHSGCLITKTETITQPPLLTATNSHVNLLCNGGGTGSATVSPTGGTGAYTYSWAPSGGTGATASGLAAASYVCTITDNNNCSITSGLTITQPPALVLSTSTTSAACGSSTGTATVSPAGGTGAYTYSWSPAGGTGATTTVVPAGNYTVTVTDANNCSQTATATIANGSGPTLVISASSNVSCNGGANGSAATTIAGGTAPFTYSWSPSGGTASAAAGLTVGTYTANVKDANGCIANATVTITQPTALSATSASVNLTCNGGSNGTISVNPSGGTGAFTYSWAPSGGTSSLATGLTAGTYTCTITDANGCIVAPSVTLTQPPAFVVSGSETDVKCNGGNTGSASVIASGGTGTLSYSWSPSGGTGTNAVGLAAGNYTCTITDSKGCSTTNVQTVKQPAILSLTISVISSTCGNANGSANAAPAGGSGLYTYSWSPGGATTNPLANVLAGIYTCNITDGNGCTASATAAITDKGAPAVSMGVVTQVSCFGACNGSASVNASGGTGALTYSWSPSGGTASGAIGLCPNTYTCTVTDANGCSNKASVTITQPPQLALTIPSSSNVNCNGDATGSATVAATGGTGSMTYSWSPYGGNATIASGLTAGLYTVTVKDANGCSAKDTITITQPARLSLSVAGIKTSCFGRCDGTLICIPAGGTNPYSFSWSSGCYAASCNNICPGNYTVHVADAHGCNLQDTTSVGQPSQITLKMFSTSAHCFHSDGSDSVRAGGGTPGYTYSWSPGLGTTSSGYDHIPPGKYVVTVSDINGCTMKDSMTVGNIPGVVATIVSITNVTCYGGNNGSAVAGGTGGTKPYTYSWAPVISAVDSATQLTAGSYTATVTDALGCSSSIVANVLQPSQTLVKPMAATTICIGQCLPLSATSAGGSPAYTFSWTQGGAAATSPVCPVMSTTYTVFSTDSKGCISLSDTVTIHVNPPLHVLATGDTSICPGNKTQLHATATGGNGSYSYTWQTALGLDTTTIRNPTANPTSSTIYTVTVFDNCGTPRASATDTVIIYNAPVAVFASADTAGCAPFCVNLTEVSNPACAQATWSFGDGASASGCVNQIHCYSAAGYYTVSLSIKDIHGCPGSITVPNYIHVFPVPKADFTFGPQPTTIVNSEIFFHEHAAGADAWSWEFGDHTNGASLLRNPSYVYPDTGCFVAQLVVKNSYQCTDTSRHPLCIYPDFTFYAPNAFTPNGDGTNDIWSPKGLGIDPTTYHLMIFDRWGNLVFETHTWGEGWDGRANAGSDIAQSDTFVWRVTLHDFLANKHTFNGLCSLIR
jgi:gliding motility-associated-like protein